MPSLRRAVSLLRQLAASNSPVSAGTLSRRLGIPRSSTYEIFDVLDELGLVVKVDGGFMLGAGVHELGSSYLRASPLQRLAHPIVRGLADTTAGTAQLAVLRGWETVYVLKEQPLDSVAVITAAGVRMPAYLTATGRAMMAELTEREVLALLQGETGFVSRTGRGPTRKRQLAALLAETRARGWALETGEITPGIRTVGAAVRDASGRPVAAVGLSWPVGPDTRAEEPVGETDEDMARAVVRAAREVTARLT